MSDADLKWTLVVPANEPYRAIDWFSPFNSLAAY